MAMTAGVRAGPSSVGESLGGGSSSTCPISKEIHTAVGPSPHIEP